MSESNRTIMPPQSSVINTEPVISRRQESQVASTVSRRIEQVEQLARFRAGDGVNSLQASAMKALGNVKLSISIDESERLPIIKIFDDETGKELLQIPAEHSLNISRTIKAAVGAIFDQKA